MSRSAMVRLVLVAAVALAASCNSSDGVVAQDPGQEATPQDVIVQDNCACNAATDCTGKVQPGVCQVAACEACACLVKSAAADTACDDGNATTNDDKCDGKGKCAGRPVSCGDGKCDPASENCGNCGLDCGCTLDKQICYENQCIAAPVDGNGKCEPTENCEANVKDCACKAGAACLEKNCVDCAAFCTGTDRECGQFSGCKCGTLDGKCPGGKTCDMVGHCYGSAICNDGYCDVEGGENCGNCQSDCPCMGGSSCKNNQCEDCGPICDAAGKECGFYQGCDCGACTVCHACTANVCKPKCDCLCWPDLGDNAKECGEIEGCQCGPLQGACAPGQDCFAFKCLEGCDTLCQNTDGTNKQCGWAQDCLCDVCTGCNACHGNTCSAGATTDTYEPNDGPAEAVDLGEMVAATTTPAKSVDATIDVATDEDWYMMVIDATGGTPKPTITLTGLAEDKDVDLDVCYRCTTGELVGVAFAPADAVFESESPIPGARCFTSFNLWGESETVTLTITACDNGNKGQSGTLYLHAYPAPAWEEYFPDQTNCGTGYTLGVAF